MIYEEVPFSMEKYSIRRRNILSMDLDTPWGQCNMYQSSTIIIHVVGDDIRSATLHVYSPSPKVCLPISCSLKDLVLLRNPKADAKPGSAI